MKTHVQSRVRFFSEVAVIASIYAVLTVVLSFISYGEIQFRIAEVLLILMCFRRSAGPGMVLGCAIANLFSPFGLVDLVLGTLATALGCLGAYLLRKQPVGIMVIPTIVANTIIVGIELLVFAGVPFWLGGGAVFIGEAAVLYILGIPFYWALKKLNFKSDYASEVADLRKK